MAIRPVYIKLVLPSRKSLEIIINIKIRTKNVGCKLIRACSLISSNTVSVKLLTECEPIRCECGQPHSSADL